MAVDPGVMANFDPTQGGGLLATVAATLASAFAGWRMLRNQNSNDSVTKASNEANIAAIDTYKQLLEDERKAKEVERAARVAAEERADKFAEERNEAWKELYQVKGKLEQMADQIMNQSQEITLLRKEVEQLRTGVPAS